MAPKKKAPEKKSAKKSAGKRTKSNSPPPPPPAFLLLLLLLHQEIFNVPLPEGVTLKSGRSTEGAFIVIGKYVKTPLDEESKETIEGSELLKRAKKPGSA